MIKRITYECGKIRVLKDENGLFYAHWTDKDSNGYILISYGCCR